MRGRGERKLGGVGKGFGDAERGIKKGGKYGCFFLYGERKEHKKKVGFM